MHSELIEINVNFNKQLLLQEANVLDGYQTFVDPLSGQSINGWNVKLISSGYGFRLTQFLKYRFKILRCQPKFYMQEPGTTLPFHTDRETISSFNFILSENPDPISFRNKTVFYKNCLLDTTVEHAVMSPSSRRIIFKISIFDKSFEEIKNSLPSNLQVL